MESSVGSTPQEHCRNGTQEDFQILTKRLVANISRSAPPFVHTP